MAKIVDKAVQLTANSLNKTLYQAIVDGDFSGGGGGGSAGPLEIFNSTVLIGSLAGSATGIAYFTAPVAKNISFIRLQVFTLGGITSGSLTVDIKKNTTPEGAGMVSIFSAAPTINFATSSAYATASGTLATSSFSAGDVLRLDITSIPSGWLGSFQITVYA